jgi:hypothetical protein
VSQYVCIGYQTYMPDIDTIGRPVDGLIQLKLNKGPDETFDQELLLSEYASHSKESVFDIELRAFFTDKP